MHIQKINRPLIKQVFSLFLKRKPDSHKGQHGRVMIIGGSKDYYGAPVLAAMAALHSGADLVYLVVPDIIADTVKAVAGANFIVRSYKGEQINAEGVKLANELAEFCDACIIGPGVGRWPGVIAACQKLLSVLKIPVILDAEAIFAIKNNNEFNDYKIPIVITPHRAEFKKLFDTKIPQKPKELMDTLYKASNDTQCYIILKGEKDLIISPKGHIFVNSTGNPGMTVGGTGDVLTGIVGSLIAQHLDVISSCNAATFVSGLAGDLLFKHYGYFFSASQVAKSLPLVLKKLI